MESCSFVTRIQSVTLIRAGMMLLLLGLLTGFTLPLLENPRMGLSSHLEGVMNGLLLVALGLIWPRLRLESRLLQVTRWLAIYAAFANWLATLLAAAWGAGRTMPLAGMGRTGTDLQEMIVAVLLLSLSAAIVVAVILVIVGLRSDHGGRAKADSREVAGRELGRV